METNRRVALLFYPLGLSAVALRGVIAFARREAGWATRVAAPEGQVLEAMRRWEPHGILTRVDKPEYADALMGLGIPVVNVSTALERLPMPRVAWDDHAIGRNVADYFHGRGFRQLAFVGPDHTWSSRQRRAGFVERAEQLGIPHAVHVIEPEATGFMMSPESWDQCEQRLARFLADLPTPAGLMNYNDKTGAYVSEVCRTLGLHVPEDLALMGVDNDDLLWELSDPPLSSVQPPAEEVGYLAARTLQRLMDGRRVASQQLLASSRIITRGSSDVIATRDQTVVEALRVIRARACDELNVKQLSAEIGVSRRVLEKRFRAAIGRTPLDEIRRVRIARAQELLIDTDHSIGDVADACGFATLSRFGKAFRQATGATPRQWRRRRQMSQPWSRKLAEAT